jgi:hypothetical protein
LKADILFVSVAIAMAAASAAANAESGKCKLLTIEEWPVRANRYRPVVDGAINGQKGGILLDTGADVSLIRRSAVAKLGLKTYSHTGHRIYGVGGELADDVAMLLGDDRPAWSPEAASAAGERSVLIPGSRRSGVSPSAN